MKFSKVHALGNDFVVIDEADRPAEGRFEVFVRRVCDRHTGVGADGLLLIGVEDAAAGRVRFRIFNANGTEAEISGNGLRCASAYLFRRGTVAPPRIRFWTTAGDRSCELVRSDGPLYEVRTEMGRPRFASPDIPFDDGEVHERIVDYPLTIGQKAYPVTVLSVGNPHCGVFFDRYPNRIEWQQIGSEIESHPFFPKRTNVEFIHVVNRSEIEVLFWERGVGETLASGTGACAAAVASMVKNLTDRKVAVRTSLGRLIVEWAKDLILQTGPAEFVFEGTWA
jgi:diaminopimelate epimerase